jgi:glycogen synthase
LGERYVGIIHPCKIYGILSTGRPFVLIGPEKSHVGDIIHESGYGFRVDHGDVEGLKSVIRQAMDLSEKEKAAVRARSQALVRQRYSRKTLTKRFIDSFLNVSSVSVV